MDAAREKQAALYEKLQNIYFLLDNVIFWVLSAIVLVGGSNSLALKVWHYVLDFCRGSFLLATPVFIIIGQLFFALITFFYDAWRDYGLEKRFELSNQTFLSWFWDWLKKFFLMTLLYLVTLGFCYAMMYWTGIWWFVFAALGWIFFQVVLGMLFPIVLLPLFYKTEKLPALTL